MLYSSNQLFYICTAQKYDVPTPLFREGTSEARVVLDCVTSLKNGADLLWIETPVPNLKKIASLVTAIREQAPHAKLVYNNSPSFNWTLSFRQQVQSQACCSADSACSRCTTSCPPAATCRPTTGTT